MGDSIWYPSVDEILTIHKDIVSEYADTSSGVRNRGDVEFAVDYIKEGSFGTVPETIHQKAYHLLRLLVTNHPFVDANKRTALNTVVVFYLLNGYRLDYDDEIKTILKRLATDQSVVDDAETIEFLRSHTEEIELVDEIERWREDLIQYGLDELAGDSSNQND